MLEKTWNVALIYSSTSFRDLIFLNGELCAVRCDGPGWFCNIDLIHPNRKPTLTAVLLPPPFGESWDYFSLYLVEICAEMLIVVRSLTKRWDKKEDELRFFRCIRWSRTWASVMDSDYALFLGRSWSFLVST